MSNPVLQSASAQASSSADTSITVALPDPTTSGSTIVVVGVDGLSSASEAGTPVSDNGSHTWSVAVALSRAGATRIIHRYAKNITGRSGHTFTYTAPTSGGFPSIAVVELGGADPTAPLDQNQSSGNAIASTNPHGTGTTGTLAQGNEIAVAGMTHTGVSSESFASAQGFDIQTEQDNTASMPVVLSTYVRTTTTGVQEQYNLTPDSSVVWVAGVSTYKYTPGLDPSSMEGFSRHSPRP